MAIEEKALSDEQKAAEADAVGGLTQKLFKTIDADADEPQDEGKEGDEEQEVQEEETGDEGNDSDKESDAEGDEKDTESEDGSDKGKSDGDEELVPRSKVDKMAARQEARIKQLTARVRQLEGSPAKSTDAADPELQKLEKMSLTELKSVKREVRLAQAREKDEAKLDKLVDLELKIDEVIAEAPGKFQSKQVELYNAMAQSIVEDDEIEDIEKAAPEIKRIAQKIYSDYPKMQRLEEGQAIALQLASEHYKALQKGGTGKAENSEKVQELKRKVNSLKRKTSLDTSRGRGLTQDQDVTKLREKAFRGADDRARIDLIKKDKAFGIDEMIPDELKD